VTSLHSISNAARNANKKVLTTQYSLKLASKNDNHLHLEICWQKLETVNMTSLDTRRNEIDRQLAHVCSQTEI